jgi:hypothetical protein
VLQNENADGHWHGFINALYQKKQFIILPQKNRFSYEKGIVDNASGCGAYGITEQLPADRRYF